MTSIVSVSVPTFNMDEEKKAFEAVFPEIINSMLTIPILTLVPEVGSWVKQILEYTISGSNFGRGLIVPIGYRMFEEPKYFSEETLHLARVLGWCIEMLQASMLMVDDMMDGATKRRGKLCWHLQPHVGPTAVNDALIIYQCVKEVLESYFRNTPFYAELMRLINKTVFATSVGQHLDCSYGYKNKEKNIDVLTMDNAKTIAIYKTSYYTFRLPILLAMVLIKNGKEQVTNELNDICLDLGLFLQSQDDYIDVYGDETLTGKTSRDIQEGKCSWVAAAALERCNEAQRSTFAECYGSDNPEHVKKIKQLYDELNIPQVYKEYESALYEDLVHRINALPSVGAKKFILEILNSCPKSIN